MQQEFSEKNGGQITVDKPVNRRRLFGFVLCAFWLALVKTAGAEVTPLTAKLEALMNGSGYKINRLNDAVYTIDFTGKQLAKFKLVVNVVAKGADGIIIIFTTPVEKSQIPNNTNIMSVLLKANSDFDYVKIGIDTEGDVFVRSDIPANADGAYFKTVVEQVAAVTDELYGKIKPLLR